MNEKERFNPEMLTLARSLREMTQGDLAKAVGTTQGRLSKIEHGLMMPDRPLTSALGKALELPESFFYQRGYIHSLPARHHRKRKQIAKRTLERVHAEITLRILNIAQFLRSADIVSENELPELDLDEIGGSPEDAARAIRERWSLPRGPVENLVETLELAGVVVVPCDFGVPEVDAVGMRMRGLPPLMFVNSAVPTDRMRFTLAHELGHLVMHGLPREEMEKEADRFAAEFLMPELDIRPQFRNVSLPLLATLKRVWRVSMAALARRAHDLKAISARAYQRLLQMLSANGWRRREPADLDLTPELPTALTALITFHRDELGYGIDQLSQIVHLYSNEFQRLYLPNQGLRLVG